MIWFAVALGSFVATVSFAVIGYMVSNTISSRRELRDLRQANEQLRQRMAKH